VFKEGEIKENDIVVPGNMDQMYLKFESVNNSIVTIPITNKILVLLETSLYKQLRIDLVPDVSCD